MFLPLTDILICPACGPGHGLILLADRIEARRVESGALGCPGCRRQYPVRRGFAELRLDPPPAAGDAPEGAATDVLAPDEQEAFRLAALMGVTRGPGYVAIVGDGARHAPRIAAMIEHLEVVACAPEAARWPEVPGVSRLASTELLPFYDGSLRAVALTANAGGISVAEAARVLAPGCRLVWEGAGPEAPDALAASGLRLLARQGVTVVAAREPR